MFSQDLEDNGEWDGGNNSDQCGLGGGAFPEHTKNKYSDYTGANEAGVLLNVLEHLTQAAEGRSDQGP